jgi:hypothetical protein
MSVLEEKSTFSDPDDLLNKIRGFLAANGWTIDLWEEDMGIDYLGPGLDGPGVDLPDEFYHRLHISKGDLFFSLHSTLMANPHVNTGTGYSHELNSSILLMGNDAFDGAEAWDEQPGHIQNMTNHEISVRMPELPVGNSTYWFFLGTAPDAFYCIAEVAPDEYRFLAFGELEKRSVWDGGAFFCASINRFQSPGDGKVYYPPMGVKASNYEYSCAGGIRVNYDGHDDWLGSPGDPAEGGNYTFKTGLGWSSSLIQTDAAWRTVYNNETSLVHRLPHYGEVDDNAVYLEYEGIMRRSYNTTNLLGSLLPIHIYGRRMPLDAYEYTLLGRLPHCHYVNMQNINIDTVYTYGSQTYRTMATHSKVNLKEQAKMPYCGLAFPVTV